jgi:transposase
LAAIVYLNPGRLENGRGLVLEKLDPSPYHSASVGVDKSAVVRHALRVADTVAFAGDGPTELQPAGVALRAGITGRGAAGARGGVSAVLALE